MAALNASIASPLADAKVTQFVGHAQIDSVLTQLLELNGWAVAFTILMVLVAYDQCKLTVTAPPEILWAWLTTGT
jgi:C-22 sterol desaturase